MRELMEIFKYTIPAIVVFITSYFLIKSFFDNEQQKRRMDLRMGSQKMTTPLKLQAYERVILLLERISPESLIVRLQTHKQTSKQLQSDMLAAIRAEFEHNLSQQIYISPQAWEMIKSTKENIVKLINSAADRIDPNAPAFDLSKLILEAQMQMEKAPTSFAIEFIKSEIKLFL